VSANQQDPVGQGCTHTSAVLEVHWPAVHVVPLVQMLPQVPQLFRSVCLFVQAPPQQFGVAASFVQSVHAAPIVPHCVSVCTACPMQVVPAQQPTAQAVGSQTQVGGDPAWQICPA